MTGFPLWKPRLAPAKLSDPAPLSGRLTPTHSPAFKSLNEQELTPLSIGLSRTDLDASGSDSTIFSQTVAVNILAAPPGAVHTFAWSCIGSDAGAAQNPTGASTSFLYPWPGNGVTVKGNWRCVVRNQFGQTAQIEVSFTLTGFTAYVPPALVGYGSGAQTIYAANGQYSVVVSFSVSASGGAPPYTYNWGGGDSSFTSSNTATISFSPGSGGTTFNPGCVITDDVGTTVAVPGGPINVVEYGY